MSEMIWNLIKTAPLDGTRILLTSLSNPYKDTSVYIGYYYTGNKDFPPQWEDCESGGSSRRRPTHWMPLPEPPPSTNITK
jgi:hypothetical protein